MEIVKAIETLNWKKKELRDLELWIEDLEVYKKPVNGVHWRKLKSKMLEFSKELEEEIANIENKIEEAVKNIEVDI